MSDLVPIGEKVPTKLVPCMSCGSMVERGIRNNGEAKCYECKRQEKKDFSRKHYVANSDVRKRKLEELHASQEWREKQLIPLVMEEKYSMRTIGAMMNPVVSSTTVFKIIRTIEEREGIKLPRFGILGRKVEKRSSRR